MRRHALRLAKLWLIRQLTYLPLAVMLFIGFRPGSGEMTPEARWHPAFLPAGPLAFVVLLMMARGWLPFDPLALGTHLFLIVGAVGIVAYEQTGFALVHEIYTPMAQAMLFVWIAAVAAVMAAGRPASLLAVPPSSPRLRLAAWLFVATTLLATGAAWILRAHEALAGLLPFLGLVGARLGLKFLFFHGLNKSQNRAPAAPVEG